jgi:RimJ/RimL family protein N-acetyltransferase
MKLNQLNLLSGNDVYLRPINKEDISHLIRWSNDPQLMGLIGEFSPLCQDSAEKYFQIIKEDKNRVWFVIVLKEDGRVIGEAGLLRMFHPWRTTDLSIIIGEKDCWAKGYGSEAAILLMNYAFGYLNFHRISIGVVGFNVRALNFWEKVGFKREGIQRDSYYFNHTYHDFVMMSILEEEFRSMYGNGLVIKI